MRIRGRQTAFVLAAGVVALSLFAYRQARAFTHFAPAGPRTRMQRLSLREKMEALLAGVEVPRPENRRTPSDVGLAYEKHVFAGGRGVPLEAWFVPHPHARGTVILFHGMLIMASHGVLDAFTDGGLGIALLWPFTNTRYSAPWRPIPVAPIGMAILYARGIHVPLTETVLFLPLFVYGLCPRRGASPT